MDFSKEINKHSELFRSVLEISFILITIIGNTLVIEVLLSKKQFRTQMNFILVNLAFADLLVGGFVTPLSIISENGLIKDNVICILLNWFIIVVSQASVFSILALSIDRYMTITQPYSFGNTRFATLICFIASAWIGGLIIGTIPALKSFLNFQEILFKLDDSLKELDQNSTSNISFPMESNSNFHQVNGTASDVIKGQCSFEKVIDLKLLILFHSFGGILLPLIITSVLYFLIYKISKFHSKQINSTLLFRENEQLSKNEIRRRSKIVADHSKSARLVGLVICSLSVCWLPLHFHNILNVLSDYQLKLPTLLYEVAIALSHAHSSVNPIIYFFMHNGFRQALLLQIQKVFRIKGVNHKTSDDPE